MEKAAWVIYYSNDSSFSSLDGLPECAPRVGVQAIGIADIGCGHYVLSEQNYYCWHFDDEQWVPHDAAGMHQYLASNSGDARKIVLQGYWIDRDRHFKLRKKALTDERLPPVSAKPPRDPGEE